MFSSFLVELLGSMLLQTDIVIGSFQIAELVQKLATTIWQTSEQEDVASFFIFPTDPDLTSMVEQNLILFKHKFCSVMTVNVADLSQFSDEQAWFLIQKSKGQMSGTL